jgi:hypothetical protein
MGGEAVAAPSCPQQRNGLRDGGRWAQAGSPERGTRLCYPNSFRAEQRVPQEDRWSG